MTDGEKRPNILAIICHDLGTRLGCYGWPSVPSPNLDALADSGVRFTRNFATATFCSPSRGAIWTGKHPHVNGLMGLVNLGWNLPPENRTLAQMLGEAGYETFLFGMQHEVKEPAQLGFHHTDTAQSRCREVAPKVVDWIKRRRPERETPFYCRIGFSEVHRPYERYEPVGEPEIPPYLNDTPGARKDFALFNAAIREMDAAVGRILEALDEKRLADNTVVVFTTDHGIAFPRAKATLYDPGINTALLLRWPRGIPGERVYDEMLSNIDLLPTLLDLACVPIPDDVEGRSFLPLVQGRFYQPRREIFAEKNTSPNDIKRAVRTQRWKYIRNYNEGPKLHLPTDTESGWTRKDLGNEHLAPRPAEELYDLKFDPHEQNNLAGHPAFQPIETSLAERLQAWQQETKDPILSGSVPRPSDEARIYAQIRQSIPNRSPYPRDGLISGFDWEDGKQDNEHVG